MTPSIGVLLRQAREVRRMSAVDVARAARISPAYLNRLENDAVRQPSPHILHQLSEALAVPYADLMRLTGYQLPGEPRAVPGAVVGATLFADITDDERDELVEYLAWHRTRRRPRALPADTALAAAPDHIA